MPTTPATATASPTKPPTPIAGLSEVGRCFQAVPAIRQTFTAHRRRCATPSPFLSRLAFGERPSPQTVIAACIALRPASPPEASSAASTALRAEGSGAAARPERLRRQARQDGSASCAGIATPTKKRRRTTHSRTPADFSITPACPNRPRHEKEKKSAGA